MASSFDAGFNFQFPDMNGLRLISNVISLVDNDLWNVDRWNIFVVVGVLGVNANVVETTKVEYRNVLKNFMIIIIFVFLLLSQNGVIVGVVKGVFQL